MSRDDAPPPMSPQEAAARLERDYQRDRDYLSELDRADRHTPAPDIYHFCDVHGWHRHILGCPSCGKKAA